LEEIDLSAAIHLAFDEFGQLLFHLVSKLYERTFIVVTTISPSEKGRLSLVTPR
jgi:hypothetical protein